MSVKEAVSKLGDAAVQAIRKELTMLLEKKVFEPVMWEHLNRIDKEKCIRSFIFMKEKYLASGKFEKVKARLVGNGAQQDRNVFESLSSPTTALTSLMIVGVISAKEHRTVATADITGAYLNAEMPTRQVMLISKEVAKILVSINGDYLKYMRNDGTVPVILKRALYGCVQSALLWYNKMRQFMTKIGFEVNKYDECVFMRNTTMVVLYVDDILVAAKDVASMEEFIERLRDEFKDITVNRGAVHNYLGMVLDFSSEGSFKVSMEKYICKIVEDFGGKGNAPTPALDNIFGVEDEEMVGQEDRETYHSAVASILYAAKRARPDVLLATSYLTTKVCAPTRGDMKKLARVLSYMNGTSSKCIVLTACSDMCIRTYIDASYGVHSDGKSHSGLVITLGTGPVFVRSCKQKIVTKSTWEAELVALSDGSSQALWTKRFVMELGYDLPVVIFQDNKSTIQSIKRGRPSSDRSRHVDIKYFWLSSQIADGIMSVEYMPTENMIADILTKAMQGQIFQRLDKELRGE